MITQIPFSILVEMIPNKTFKNIVFWLNLMIGQPLAITMYFKEYVLINNGDFFIFLIHYSNICNGI